MSGCQPDHHGPGKLIIQVEPCSGEGWAVGELEAGLAFDLIWGLSKNMCLVMETFILKTGGVWAFAYSLKWTVWGPQYISGSKVSACCGLGSPLRIRPVSASVLKGLCESHQGYGVVKLPSLPNVKEWKKRWGLPLWAAGSSSYVLSVNLCDLSLLGASY